MNKYQTAKLSIKMTVWLNHQSSWR